MSDISYQSCYSLAYPIFAICLQSYVNFSVSIKANFAFVMETVYANYKPMTDLIIGQIDNNMLIGQHIAITSDKIIAHIDVFSVVELPYRNLKEFLAPINLIFAINETSDVLVWVSDDVNQSIIVIGVSSEKLCLL